MHLNCILSVNVLPQEGKTLNMPEVTDVLAWYVLEHCSTRCCSIMKVILRILEQRKNVCEYFWKILEKFLKGN